uniref:Putative secreted protein n=1 Tax=Anopheles marajoara TaxID=58244 RepID=A0A2M4CCZ3_9DIPT
MVGCFLIFRFVSRCLRAAYGAPPYAPFISVKAKADRPQRLLPFISINEVEGQTAGFASEQQRRARGSIRRCYCY